MSHHENLQVLTRPEAPPAIFRSPDMDLYAFMGLKWGQDCKSVKSEANKAIKILEKCKCFPCVGIHRRKADQTSSQKHQQHPKDNVHQQGKFHETICWRFHQFSNLLAAQKHQKGSRRRYHSCLVGTRCPREEPKRPNVANHQSVQRTQR